MTKISDKPILRDILHSTECTNILKIVMVIKRRKVWKTATSEEPEGHNDKMLYGIMDGILDRKRTLGKNVGNLKKAQTLVDVFG